MNIQNLEHKSVWSMSDVIPEREPLDGNLTVEAVVIGAGLAGVLTAHFLQEAGIKTVVLEASKIGSGQSRNTTAKITSQHGLIYHRLIEEFGIEKAKQYADANEQAIKDYRDIINKYGIDCDFSDSSAWLYSPETSDAVSAEFEAALSLGLPAYFEKDTELPFPVEAALKFDNQAMFNPVKFIKAISENLRIYEDTRAIRVDGGCVETERGNVYGKYIIFTDHYTFVNFPGYYFLRMHQARSYVVAVKNATQLMGMYYGLDDDGLSYRSYGDILLVGGGNHRTGENSEGGQYDKLFAAAKKLWPECEYHSAWSAQDCMPVDGIPYIGKFSKSESGWYVATGFQKWGMTSAMVAARIIRDKIVKGKSPNEEVFAPERFMNMASMKEEIEEAKQAMKGLAREFLVPVGRKFVDNLPDGHGGIVELEGKKVGVYKDEHGNIYAVSTRCPHLGCQLEWNPDEKSWDCPCHGSRFDFRGNLIDNPAQTNLEHRFEAAE